MGPFGKKKIVVKTYYREATSNALTLAPRIVLSVATLGTVVHLSRSQDQAFERDAKAMAKKGYKVLSVNNGGSAMTGKNLTVTYGLVDTPK